MKLKLVPVRAEDEPGRRSAASYWTGTRCGGLSMFCLY
jgi:hypothetical protein